ncbi:acyltransferase [Corallincola luteus]|uniref:Acyltransferase n=1 Tax=Corallincola luteus TaxID=1775177 RepID=A0ABY2AJU2_9GAMM|nr:acyltransferase [Corallincola luteus]TCI03076.1 acyltransferase [Corallincola luteus]
MPWLYYRLKPKHKLWALAWQQQQQAELMALETIQFGEDCFVAPEANLFAEPGRQITIGDRTAIAADTFIHGPLTLGRNVGINHGCSFDGGRHGITIGDNSRIASGVAIYAFNHGLAANALIDQQPVNSQGVVLGKDVWVGSRACIRDGVEIADHAVVGMGAVVTKNVPAYAIVAGNPARIIGDRRDKPDAHPDYLAAN